MKHGGVLAVFNCAGCYAALGRIAAQLFIASG